MRNLWDRFEIWLEKNAPTMLEALNPGAAPEEIAEVERVLGVSLPDDVRESFLIHNGCSERYPLFREQFMSLERALETRRIYLQHWGDARIK